MIRGELSQPLQNASDEKLALVVDKAVARGVEWLLACQLRDGSWRHLQYGFAAGQTALSAYTLDHVGMERIPYGNGDTEQSRTASGEQLRGRVRAVAEVSGDFQNPGSRLLAGSCRAANHYRDRGSRNACSDRNICQCGPAPSTCADG